MEKVKVKIEEDYQGLRFDFYNHKEVLVGYIFTPFIYLKGVLDEVRKYPDFDLMLGDTFKN